MVSPFTESHKGLCTQSRGPVALVQVLSQRVPGSVCGHEEPLSWVSGHVPTFTANMDRNLSFNGHGWLASA